MSLQSKPLPSSTAASVRVFPAQNQCWVIGAKETEQFLYRQAQIKYIDTEPKRTKPNQIEQSIHFMR